MKNKIKSKKRLYLFIPLMAVLVLMNVAAFAVAVIGKNVWLFIACFFLLVFIFGLCLFAMIVIGTSRDAGKFQQGCQVIVTP